MTIWANLLSKFFPTFCTDKTLPVGGSHVGVEVGLDRCAVRAQVTLQGCTLQKTWKNQSWISKIDFFRNVTKIFHKINRLWEQSNPKHLNQSSPKTPFFMKDNSITQNKYLQYCKYLNSGNVTFTLKRFILHTSPSYLANDMVSFRGTPFLRINEKTHNIMSFELVHFVKAGSAEHKTAVGTREVLNMLAEISILVFEN